MKHICTGVFTLLLFWGNAQEFNQEVTMENGQSFMVGKINLKGLNSAPYSQWFQKGKESYQVDSSMVHLFRDDLNDYSIKLFLGTWCGDSRRETPRVIKILEAADFPMEQLEIVALDHRKGLYKTSPTGEEKGLNIIKVPTIIFFKNGKEVNRIVESPLESLEEDMAQILLKKTYTPNYAH